MVHRPFADSTRGERIRLEDDRDRDAAVEGWTPTGGGDFFLAPRPPPAPERRHPYPHGSIQPVAPERGGEGADARRTGRNSRESGGHRRVSGCDRHIALSMDEGRGEVHGASRYHVNIPILRFFSIFFPRCIARGRDKIFSTLRPLAMAMARLRHLVASIVVFSSFYRLNDSEFIMRSFNVDGEGASSLRPGGGRGLTDGGRLKSEPKRTRRRHVAGNVGIGATVPPPSERRGTGSYVAGDFCRLCSYSDKYSCAQRVGHMMKRYKISEEKAKDDALVRERCTAAPIYHNTYSHEDEPALILHAGPHKTGTTAMQAFVYDLIYANATIFEDDGLRVPTYDELPGVFAKEGVGLNLPHCSIARYKRDGGSMNLKMCARMREAFPRFMLDAYNRSQDVLTIAEDFDRKEIDFERLRFYIRPYKRMKVGVTYRRLHDWLPSFYNQIVDHYIEVYINGEERFPSFVEWLGARYEEFLLSHAIEVAHRFRSYDIVERVDIFNIHELPDLIKGYFCDHIWAEGACQAARRGTKPTKSNIGIEHDYQRLLVAASRAGKIKDPLIKRLRLNRAMRQVKDGVEKTKMDLPKVCPDNALLERVVQKEIEHETTYFPIWYESQGGEEGLRESFKTAVTEKFCSLHVEKILQTGMLDAILQGVKIWG